MTMRELAEGSVFASRYRVVRAIAKGGMGAVYEVVHIETERHRALKVMLPHIVSSDELRGRFRQEARVAAKVESAYIVDVFDAGVDEETKMPFLVMELLRGEELGKRLSRLGRLSPREVVTYLGQTAMALDKTHRANIVHRDLKPENLFLAEQDDGRRIKVLDFGIAKLVAEQGTEANATQSIGTPMYMAPEQFLPRSKVSPATDIFSLGMMAYTLLVGSAYWREERESLGNVYAFVGAVMGGPTESAIARAMRQGVELPAAFDAWFARVTANDPTKRFGKASEAIEALGRVFEVSEVGEGLSIETRNDAQLVAPVSDVDDKATIVMPRKPPSTGEVNGQATEFGLSSSKPVGVRQTGPSNQSLSLPSRRSLALIAASGFFLTSLVVLVFAAVVKHNKVPRDELTPVVGAITSSMPSGVLVVSTSTLSQVRVAPLAPVASVSATIPFELEPAPEKSKSKRLDQRARAPAPPPAPSPVKGSGNQPSWDE